MHNPFAAFAFIHIRVRPPGFSIIASFFIFTPYDERMEISFASSLSSFFLIPVTSFSSSSISPDTSFICSARSILFCFVRFTISVLILISSSCLLVSCTKSLKCTHLAAKSGETSSYSIFPQPSALHNILWVSWYVS